MTRDATRAVFLGTALAVMQLAAGCDRLTQSEFWHQSAESYCEYLEACTTGFYVSYDSLRECKLQMRAVNIDEGDCRFDRQRAKECLEALSQASTCDEMEEVNFGICTEVRHDCHSDTASY